MGNGGITKGVRRVFVVMYVVFVVIDISNLGPFRGWSVNSVSGMVTCFLV